MADARICLNRKKDMHSHIVLIGTWKKGTKVSNPVEDVTYKLQWKPTLVPDDPLAADSTRLTIRLKCSKEYTVRDKDDGGPSTGDLTITVDNGGDGSNVQTVIVPDVAYAADSGAG